MTMFNKIFKYDKKSGELKRNNSDKPVGSVNSAGYRQVEVKGKAHMLHHVVWNLEKGKIPKGMQVDHKDRNRLNNKVENLRLASKSENQINTKVPVTNTTGFKGVLKTKNGKFQARLGHKGKKLYLGLFKTAEEAAKCVKEHTKKLYGEFTPND
jgi:phosphotransferase system IIB component